LPRNVKKPDILFKPKQKSQRVKECLENRALRLSKKRPYYSALLWLLAYLVPHWPYIFLVVLGTGGYAACHQGKYVLIKPFVDDVATLSDDFLPQLRSVFVWLILLAFGEFLLGTVQKYFVKYVFSKTNIDIRRELLDKTLRQEMNFLARWRLGDLLQRMGNDVAVATQGINLLVDDLVLQPFLMLAATCVALYASWQLTILTLAFLGLVVYPMTIIGRKIRKQASKRQRHSAEVSHVYIQTLTGFKTVKMFGREAHESERFFYRTQELFRKMMRVVRTKAIGDGAVSLVMGLVLPVAVVAGMWAVREKVWGLTSGSLVMFVAAAQAMYKPTSKLAKAYNQLSDSLSGSQRLFAYVECMQPPRPRSGVKLPDVVPSIEFEHVKFRYDEAPVLEDVSFKVPAGSVTALVGRSGGGKTTILDLLTGLYKCNQGHIMVAETDIQGVAFDSYVQAVAVVPQEPFLFAATLKENILYGRLDATDEEIIEAAKIANIHEFITQLPQGYDTVVGTRGETLSGGQRQRIAIARAVVKNARILLLDEATSALDAESERLVYQAFERLMVSHERTTVVVAHRLSTVMNADQIIVIDSGRVVEQGRHEQLIKQAGVYCQLFQTQSRSSNNM
jgi:ATP-binding cassette, subfamily B, bacterial MsbA